MGIPPESKDKSSAIIETLVKLMLLVIILPPALGILYPIFAFITYAPKKYKNSEIMQNIGDVNQRQGAYILENGVFAKTFDKLATGFIYGGSIDSSQTYELDIQSQDFAIIRAKTINKEKHGFNGAVLRYKNKKGFFGIKSIICESTIVGADGTNLKNLPAVNASEKLICAPEWEVLQENNKEPSDRELAKLIQDRASSEIQSVLHKQDLNYIENGRFVNKYKDIPQKENNSLLKFDVKIIQRKDRAIIFIQHDLSEKDKYKTSFGFIKIVRSRQAQPLGDSDREKKTILWHYLDTISFICTSDRIGTPLPKNKELNRVVDRCPSGYTKDKISERKGGFNLVRDNLATIRMVQEGYYEQYHKFMTDFAEFEKFSIENSRRYASFIRVSQDPYQYNFRANGKQLVVIAQPKSFKDPLSNTTYLRMSSATGTVQYWPHVYTYCESKIPNIPIPTDEDISKIGLNQERQSVYYLENCPAGYTLVKQLE